MINKAILLGRIGKKVYKQTKTGVNMCTLYIATERKYLDSKGSPTKITTWHRVNFFHQKAEIVEKYAQVGELIHIEGEIINREIEKNGVSILDHSITGERSTFIPNTKRENFIKSEKNNVFSIAHSTEEDEEEIPY